MNKRQTSLDFYMKSSFELQSALSEGTITTLKYIKLHEKMYIKAIKMHKEEIIDAGSNHCYPTCASAVRDAEEYYNENYGNDKQ